MSKFSYLLLLLVFNLSAQTDTDTAAITYHQHIAPILQTNCTPCHQTNKIAPMSLTNYKEVVAYGKMIAHVTQIGLMPPFIADEPTEHNTFKNEKRLLEKEIQLIQTWMQQGFLEGKPPQEKTTVTSISTLKDKDFDVTISMSEAFEQYGVYYDQYKVFVLPTHFKEDKWISAIEFVAGNPQIVRHATISLDTSKQAQKWDDWDPQYGYFSFGTLGFVPSESHWYSWNPSQSYTQFPANQAKFLPKNATLLLHLHYGPTGYPQKDSSSIRLKFATKPKPTSKLKIPQTAALIHSFNMTNDTFFIATNEKTRYHAKFTVPFDMQLFGLYPQAHYLGRKWEVFAVEPNQRQAEVLLKIKDWNFHWKQFFEYQTPKILKKGTVVHALAEYDNTSTNLSNPNDPPRNMAWGKRMYEELFLVYFNFAAHSLSNAPKPAFQISFTSTNIIHPQFEVPISVEQPTQLTFEVKDFEGNTLLQLFKNQAFKKGEHAIVVDLKELRYGNYYFCLKSENEEVNRTFIYLPKSFMD